MATVQNLRLPQRKEKSYVRSQYRTDTVFTFLNYKNIRINFAKKEGTVTRTTDLLGQTLLEAGLITRQQLDACQNAISAEYYHKNCHSDQSPEDIYAFVQKMRLAHYGQEALSQGHWLQEPGNVPDGIDQTKEKEALLQRCDRVLFLLCDGALLSHMKEDLALTLAAGKEAVVCCSPRGEGDLPTREALVRRLGALAVSYREATPEGIDANTKNACLFFYGEEGLLHCRDLTLDAFVTAVPRGYHAQALCNLLGDPRLCRVYIPGGTDITPYVPLTSRARLTYYHLAQLCRDHGEGIYRLSCQALYSKYPQYFINIYHNGENALPLQVSGETLPRFDKSRDGAVADFLNSFSNVQYAAAYFDEAGKQAALSYEETLPQKGILVHSIRVKQAKNARVISCPKGVTPRTLLAKEPATALVSNFLFFLTEKLGVLYNDLRSDRPAEQADAAAGHLDYMLCHENGARKETFPLFAKTCIAGTNDGGFLFFSFALGGGKLRWGSHCLSWKKEDVNPTAPGDICVYTPMFTATEKDADRETYRLPVGHGRVNMVILQDRITCLRKGDVILPSVGVVVSMTEKAAAPLLAGRASLGDGYYTVDNTPLTVELSPPEAVPGSTWDTVQWAYGGGMGLICDGEALCDGDMDAWFARQGWMSPLSRQTQESALHKLAKHPRTAIGTAANGDLLILVYSGRSSRSSGADYREMIHIARSLYPDVRNLMNVDGGGSAMLGLVHKGAFMELSYPATSMGSCAGQVRPINTIFYIPTEGED
ncbi:MAG: phosphodiester glycosidase family protein [Oscillospiraceae bacterium]|nr:phosphodiester glycosidase family protein [Oscillospiraceae bacterium]